MSRIRSSVIWGLYIILITVFILTSLEIGSRIILPISPGAVKMNLSGEPITIPFNKPDVKYYQVFDEYNALTTIDEQGNRVVPTATADKPSVVFLGDSFTFGQGLSDEDTIPGQVCTKIRLNCINLGVPGSGLIVQNKKLTQYLNNNSEKPVRVLHLLLASTTLGHAGNDISDTYNEVSSTSYTNNAGHEESSSPAGIKNQIIELARSLMRNSNLVRVLSTVIGLDIRSFVFRYQGSRVTEEQLKMFSEQINIIKSMTEKYGIQYNVILLSTYPELNLDLRAHTVAQLEAVTGLTFKYLALPDTAKPNIKSWYFELDGHFNKTGANVISDFIVKTYFEK